MRTPCSGVIAFLLVSALAGPAGAQGYPRLGQYLSTSGTGDPLVHADGSVDAELRTALARHHTVVLSASPFTEYRADVLNQLEAAHPGIVLLAYLQPQYVYPHEAADSAVNIPTRLRHLVRDLNGYLYDKQGEEFRNANVNLAKRQGNRYVVAEALADFYRTAILQGHPWDGLFLDRFCNSILWDQAPADSIDFARAGYASAATFDAAWLAATDTLANRLRRTAGSAPILVGNCGQGTKYASMNGWMRENFPYQNGGTWTSNMFGDPGGYLIDEQRFRSPRSNWLTAWPDLGQSAYSPENARRARYALGSAALGDGSGVLNPPDLDATTKYWGWWFDEYGVAVPSGTASQLGANAGWLGQPLGPYRIQFWAGDGIDAVSNGSFETNVTTGWTFTTSAGASVVRDAVGAPVGNACAHVLVPSAGAGTTSTRYRSTGMLFYLPPLVHSLTFWARAASPRTIVAAAVNVANQTDFVSSTVAIDATWRQYQVQWSTGMGFGNLQVEFRFGGTARDVWLDDVHCQRGTTSIYRRDFTNGVVFVNPGEVPLFVPLEALYRHIVGVADPVTNNGLWTTEAFVAASDALFLVRQPSGTVAAEPDPGAAAAAGPLWRQVAPNPALGPVRALLDSGGAADAVSAGPVEVDVLDVRGRRVAALLRAARLDQPASVVWDGRDDHGRSVGPGIFWLRARVGSRVETRKILRLATGSGS